MGCTTLLGMHAAEHASDCSVCMLLAGSKPLPIIKLVDSFDASWDYVANDGEAFTFKTNLDAPRYRCAAFVVS